MPEPSQTVNQLKDRLEEILRDQQVTLQDFADLIDKQHGVIDTGAYAILYALSILALNHKAQTSRALEEVKDVSLIRRVS